MTRARPNHAGPAAPCAGPPARAGTGLGPGGDARRRRLHHRARLRGRFAKFGPEIRQAKTRLIEFGQPGGESKPETVDFLSFTHICRKIQERPVLAETDHDLETDAGEAESGQRPAQAVHLPAHTGPGPLAGGRGARAHGLLAAFRDQVTRHWLRAPGRRSNATQRPATAEPRAAAIALLGPCHGHLQSVAAAVSSRLSRV